jgi:hypothetical protein
MNGFSLKAFKMRKGFGHSFFSSYDPILSELSASGKQDILGRVDGTVLAAWNTISCEGRPKEPWAHIEFGEPK